MEPRDGESRDGLRKLKYKVKSQDDIIDGEEKNINEIFDAKMMDLKEPQR
jgi:hypothetical protein